MSLNSSRTLRILAVVYIIVAITGITLFVGTRIASAHSGNINLSENCHTWSGTVTLSHNTTPDRLVEVTSTIPGTSGISGHFDTSYGQIWSANGTAPVSGTVTLKISHNGSVEFYTSASIAPKQDCDPTPTATTQPSATPKPSATPTGTPRPSATPTNTKVPPTSTVVPSATFTPTNPPSHEYQQISCGSGPTDLPENAKVDFFVEGTGEWVRTSWVKPNGVVVLDFFPAGGVGASNQEMGSAWYQYHDQWIDAVVEGRGKVFAWMPKVRPQRDGEVTMFWYCDWKSLAPAKPASIVKCSPFSAEFPAFAVSNPMGATETKGKSFCDPHWSAVDLLGGVHGGELPQPSVAGQFVTWSIPFGFSNAQYIRIWSDDPAQTFTWWPGKK